MAGACPREMNVQAHRSKHSQEHTVWYGGMAEYRKLESEDLGDTARRDWA